MIDKSDFLRGQEKSNRHKKNNCVDAGGQQLIVTGDPVATQKFLESLSDGSTDLAGILAKAEGGSVLIQTDGQQILIRTNTESQPDLGLTDSEVVFPVQVFPALVVCICVFISVGLSEKCIILCIKYRTT